MNKLLYFKVYAFLLIIIPLFSINCKCSEIIDIKKDTINIQYYEDLFKTYDFENETELKDLLREIEKNQNNELIKNFTEKLDNSYIKSDVNINKQPDTNFIQAIDISTFLKLQNCFNEMNQKESKYGYRDNEGNLLSTNEDFIKYLSSKNIKYVHLYIVNEEKNNNKIYGGKGYTLEKSLSLINILKKYNIEPIIHICYSNSQFNSRPESWTDNSNILNYTYSCIEKLKENNVKYIIIGNDINDKFCGIENHDEIINILNQITEILKKENFIVGISINNSVYIDKIENYEFAAISVDLSKENCFDKIKEYSDLLNDNNKKILLSNIYWGYTDQDFDGFKNELTEHKRWTLSKQGQINCFQDIIKFLYENCDNAMGMIYENCDRLSLYNVYIKKDEPSPMIYVQNQKLYEKYGAGDSSSYLNSHNKTSLSTGNAYENCCFWNNDGYPTDIFNLFNKDYLKYGTKSKEYIDCQKTLKIDITLGDTLNENIPSDLVFILNNGIEKQLPVTWNYDDIERIRKINEQGDYILTGKTYYYDKEYEVNLNISIKYNNFIENSDFNNDNNNWEINNLEINNNFGFDDNTSLSYNINNSYFSATQDIIVNKEGIYNYDFYVRTDDKSDLYLTFEMGDKILYSEHYRKKDASIWDKITINNIEITKEMIKKESGLVKLSISGFSEKESSGNIDSASFYIINNTLKNNTEKSIDTYKNNTETGSVFKIDDLKYKIIDKESTILLSGAEYKKSILNIPDFVKYNNKEYKVTKIAEKAFYNNKCIAYAIIGNNITIIGNSAFENCNLKSLEIGTGIKQIGNKCFKNNKLETLKINSIILEDVGNKAFKKSIKSTNFIFPEEKQTEYKRKVKFS